jgi:hypothetical protein
MPSARRAQPRDPGRRLGRRRTRQRLGERGIAQRLERLVVRLRALRRRRAPLGEPACLAPGVGNLGEIARARSRDQRLARREFRRRQGQRFAAGRGPVAGPAGLLVQQRAQRQEQAVHARVVEAAGDGGKHRQLRIREARAVRMIAAPLLAHVAQRVFRAALLELVEHHHVGEVEHVDLLELAGRAVFGRHHVQRDVGEIHDLGVALADARGLDDHEIEAGGAVQRDHVREHGAGGEMLAARGQRTHEHPRRGQRVHADAVAQQCAAGAPPRGIDGHHRRVAIRKGAQETLQQFVGQRALAGTAGAGDADHRRAPRLHRRAQRAPQVVDVAAGGGRAAFEQRDGARQRGVVMRRRQRVGNGRRRAPSDAREHVFDHAREAQATAVLGCVDARHAVGLQVRDLVRRDGAAPAHHHADVRGMLFAQHVDHVAEVLVVAALVTADGDGVGVLADGGAHDVRHAAVVAEMHDLGARRLQQPADHVDGGVVAVEQRRRRHEAQRPSWLGWFHVTGW